jgi:2-haloacid dehalogenase
MNLPFIFFDLDNTLLDFDWAERRALSAVLRGVGVEPSDELLQRYHEINRSQWELMEDGVLTREQVLLRRFELLFEERGISASAPEIRDDYEARLAWGHRFIPGAQELLDALKGKYRLFLASNGTASVQEGRLRSSGIRPYFEAVFVSEELGAEKPSREFFLRCFRQISGFDPSRALIVGDSLSSDIRGGINAGIKTCWFNPSGAAGRSDIHPDYEIRTLSELLPLCEKVLL